MYAAAAHPVNPGVLMADSGDDLPAQKRRLARLTT